MVKEKLTLSVDKDVIEKAKKIGINISDITEKVLRGYTSAERPEGSLYDGYKQLFDSITPLLKEFGVDMKIAGTMEQLENDKGELSEWYIDIFLEPDGSFWNDTFETSFQDIKKIDLRAFLSPEKILSNLVDVLAKSEEAKKEKISEILMAKRIIDAMAETLVKNDSIKTKAKLKEETKIYNATQNPRENMKNEGT